MSWGGRRIAGLRRAVIAEYGAVCVHCHGVIDLDRRHPDPLSLSIDHVVPRSRGGSDELANLRPAHLHCNCSRGDRMKWRSRAASSGRFF